MYSSFNKIKRIKPLPLPDENEYACYRLEISLSVDDTKIIDEKSSERLNHNTFNILLNDNLKVFYLSAICENKKELYLLKLNSKEVNCLMKELLNVLFERYTKIYKGIDEIILEEKWFPTSNIEIDSDKLWYNKEDSTLVASIKTNSQLFLNYLKFRKSKGKNIKDLKMLLCVNFQFNEIVLLGGDGASEEKFEVIPLTPETKERVLINIISMLINIIPENKDNCLDYEGIIN